MGGYQEPAVNTLQVLRSYYLEYRDFRNNIAEAKFWKKWITLFPMVSSAKHVFVRLRYTNITIIRTYIKFSTHMNTLCRHCVMPMPGSTQWERGLLHCWMKHCIFKLGRTQSGHYSISVILPTLAIELHSCNGFRKYYKEAAKSTNASRTVSILNRSHISGN